MTGPPGLSKFFSFDSPEDVHEVRIWTDWQSHDWHVTGRKWTLRQGHRKVMEGTGLKEAVSQYTSWSEDFRKCANISSCRLQMVLSVFTIYPMKVLYLFVVALNRSCSGYSNVSSLFPDPFTLKYWEEYTFLYFTFTEKLVSFLFCFIFVLRENNQPITGRWWG